jgi:ATP-dependent DNA helicase RecG
MANKESQTIEYKQTWRNDWLKVLSAFANGNGGILIIGIDDNGVPVGLKNTQRLLEDIPNTVRHKLGIIPSVELKKNNTIEISVKPGSIPVSFNGRYYLRSGGTVQELQGSELSDFILRKSGVTWDDIIEEDLDSDSLDKATIEDFKRFSSDRLPSISLEQKLSAILNKLKLSKNSKLKRAAILLFGIESEVDRHYSHACIKIGQFATETDIKMTDIVNGNLFQQLNKTLDILRSKYLKSEIKFEGIHRRDILEYPHEALREAIINALIHRDYQSFSNIQIRIYPDKLTIMNAGSLPPEVPLDSLKEEHLSKPRNKLLAETFYYAGFIEAWGRGTLKIIEKCRDQGIPEPEFKNENHVMTVIFYKDKWNEENLKKMGLNERQIKAVKYVKEREFINNSKYREINVIGKTTATEDLQKLVEKGIFTEPVTKGRGVKYRLKN